MKQLFFFLIAFPIFLMAETTDSTKQKRFAIGINFSPDYCYRNYIQLPRITDNSQDYYIYNELPKYGYTTGLTFDVNIGKRFMLETGILFADKGIKMDETVYDQIYSNGTKHIYSSAKSQFHNYFLDVPIKATINILSKRFKLYVSTGAALNIVLGYKKVSEVSYPNQPSTNSTISNYNTSHQSPFSITLLLGIGASYELTKKIVLKIEPIYRQNLISTFQLKSDGVFYSIGTNVGVSYRF
jgi:opacity protein-like surface antigen